MDNSTQANRNMCAPKPIPPCQDGFEEKYMKTKKRNCCVKTRKHTKKGKKKSKEKIIDANVDIEILESNNLSENNDAYTFLHPQANRNMCAPKPIPPCQDGFEEKYMKTKKRNCCVKTRKHTKKGKKKSKEKIIDANVDIEILESNNLSENNDAYTFLHPNINDPNFNSKISERKEFSDLRYNGDIKNAEFEGDSLCNAEFELQPYQSLVKNFLSYETPYNNLLLYHGLGSGKTCSAIGVAEDMRDYQRYINKFHRIIVVASPNVQNNFKTQLFDERNLEYKNGIWRMRGCVGNKYLKEISKNNPVLDKDIIVKEATRIINDSYQFFGYTQFANFINKKTSVKSDVDNKDEIEKKKMRKEFDDRLIIIDEAHNARITQDNSNKYVAQELLKLVKTANNVKLLLLSGTPMYNSHEEIVWLLNLMNSNDKRTLITTKDVFDTNGSFKEGGRELLERKAMGYVSYVRGENPYTFPYRIWPQQFDPNSSIFKISKKFRADTDIEILDLYITNLGSYQEQGYAYILSKIDIKILREEEEERKDEIDEEMRNKLGYTVLQKPLEGLNIVYPHEDLGIGDNVDVKELVGKGGLRRIMKHKLTSSNPPIRYSYDYISTKWGKVFSPVEIGKYSGKIKAMCEQAINSNGPVLIYSQYIDGGVVPVALALEELGFTRAGKNKSLLNKPPTPLSKHRYVMITGDKSLSINNNEDVKLCTNKTNVNGDDVKVILISQAGSEGLDFKFIRQVHIMEPWYNMNRIEQIIGRAIRTCSHKELPFQNRNVEIYLHGSNTKDAKSMDIHVYKNAEVKAVKIGHVTRLLKEISFDCFLNHAQSNFTEEMMNQTVELKLSSGKTIKYALGDKPKSSLCDYKDNCVYVCKSNRKVNEITNNNNHITSMKIVNSKNDQIINHVQGLFKESFFYNKHDLMSRLKVNRSYSQTQIFAALTQMIENENETENISDMFGRQGVLVNIDDMYLFQPLELTKPNISLFDRSTPIEIKHPHISINPVNNDDFETIADEKAGIEGILETINKNYSILTNVQMIERGHYNWYTFGSIVIDLILQTEETANKELLLELAMAHMIEEMSYKDIVLLMNYLEKEELSDTELKLKKYFDNETLEYNDVQGILLSDRGNNMVFVKSKDKKWSIAQAEDIMDLLEALKERKNQLKPLNILIGFMSHFKRDDNNVFKLKDLSNKRSTGRRCDQSGKMEAIKSVNEIIGSNKYNSKSRHNGEELPQIFYCVLQELLLRLYDKNQKKGKRWFLSLADEIILKTKKYI